MSNDIDIADDGYWLVSITYVHPDGRRFRARRKWDHIASSEAVIGPAAHVAAICRRLSERLQSRVASEPEA